MLKKRAKELNLTSEYKFVKNVALGKVIGWWCLLFTAFACILGVVPKSGEPFSAQWNFQIILNIVTPFVFIGLGLILPAIAKKNKAK
jgi:ABC-type uncharacterized transport system permease subunit